MSAKKKVSLYANCCQEIETTPENLARILRGSEVELGLEPNHELPKIVQQPLTEMELESSTAAYDPLKKEIVVPPEAPEADVFHELVHYLMDCEGLLFTHFHLKPDLQFEETLFFFYEKLIDETMAEYATFKVFDYDQETVIMYPKNGIAEDYRELQRIFLSGDDQEIEKRLPKLEQMIGRSIYQCYFERQLSYLTEAARLIAVDNTLKLQEKSIRTLDLIARIREAKTRLSNPTEIYIESIAEAMR